MGNNRVLYISKNLLIIILVFAVILSLIWVWYGLQLEQLEIKNNINNMKKKSINLKGLGFIVALATNSLMGQSAAPSVIASSGNYSTAAWGSISSTIGQVAYATSTANGTILSQGYQQSYVNSTSIQKVKLSNNLDLKLYPNPTNGLLNLELNAKEQGTYQLQIVDANGKNVFSFNENSNQSLISQQFDLSTLASGIYTVILQFTNTKTNQSEFKNTKLNIIH